MKDQDVVLTALNEAALIIGDYLEPGIPRQFRIFERSNPMVVSGRGALAERWNTPTQTSHPSRRSRFHPGRVFLAAPMFRTREILVFVLGMVLATLLTVMGTFYFLKNYVLLHDSRDPLIKQGGLKPSQEIKR
jgi:hypothetical protein